MMGLTCRLGSAVDRLFGRPQRPDRIKDGSRRLGTGVPTGMALPQLAWRRNAPRRRIDPCAATTPAKAAHLENLRLGHLRQFYFDHQMTVLHALRRPGFETIMPVGQNSSSAQALLHRPRQFTFRRLDFRIDPKGGLRHAGILQHKGSPSGQRPLSGREIKTHVGPKVYARRFIRGGIPSTRTAPALLYS
jgi:hypothetical protein